MELRETGYGGLSETGHGGLSETGYGGLSEHQCSLMMCLLYPVAKQPRLLR